MSVFVSFLRARALMRCLRRTVSVRLRCRCVKRTSRLAAEIRALVINTGNANAGTGQAGLRDARAMAEAGAKALGLHVEQVLPFSTGVILEPLPIARVVAGIAKAAEALSEANWLTAAQGIMTTDTQPRPAVGNVWWRVRPSRSLGSPKALA